MSSDLEKNTEFRIKWSKERWKFEGEQFMLRTLEEKKLSTNIETGKTSNIDTRIL